jgi:ribosomal protein S18 acetylase RimI-like enzyme
VAPLDSPMPTLIRPATAADIDSIVAFAAKAIPDTYVPLLGAPHAEELLAQWWSREQLAADIAADIVLVAVPHHSATEDPIIGYVHVARLNDEPVMWKLYVAPSRRSTGHGSKLVDAAIAALGPDASTLLTEHIAANRRAGAFYEREGFVRVDDGSMNDDGDRPGGAEDPAAPVWRRRLLR